MNREYIDPCPIHTLDEAILWLAQGKYEIEFWDGWIYVQQAEEPYTQIRRQLGNGFDARGALMMATRDLWMLLNGETQNK